MRCAAIILAFGDDDDLHAEAWTMLLTTLRYAPPTLDLLIMTDRPERYRWFGGRVRTVEVSGERLAAWKGEHGLFSRIKLEFLRDFLAREQCDVLCLDADMFARRDLGPLVDGIRAGRLFMHLKEYRWARPPSPRQRRVWRHVGGKTFAGHTVRPETVMWNAGVLGFAWEHRVVVERMLAVYDAFAASGLHRLRHTVQQHSISLVMQQHGPLEPAEPFFDHYWANKPGHDLAIREHISVIATRGYAPDEAARWMVEHPIRLPLVYRPRWWHRALRRLVPRWA
ncbi:MAG TPA: hypothetical protein VEL07_18890 [Planctomycetota bacterium]|nr:hypothetical protein [Planctomycetota bacterium]